VGAASQFVLAEFPRNGYNRFKIALPSCGQGLSL
jgi:hypothetical protein